MRPPLIGLTGKKRSGKDTAARFLIADYGYARVAFADPMRDGLLRLNPLVGRPALPDDPAPRRDLRLSELVDAVGWEAAKETVPEVRRLLQEFGTAAVRDLIGEDVWVRLAFAEIERLRDAGQPVVVTDVRFPNEAAAIRRAGGTLVRVTRANTATDAHASETALDDTPADLTLENDGTLEDLHARTKTAHLHTIER